MRDIWDSPSPRARLLRTLLLPLSGLYALGWQGYLATYRLGFKKAASPHRPILCVGNLQVGGSGKSPMVRYLAQLLQEMGHSVVIACSGYGAPHAEAATLAPSGPLDAAEWGDEPAMFRDQLPELPIVVGRRRVLAAELVHTHHPDAVMLMDDGFQHLPLAKQINLVLDPAQPANRFCLPAGPYREPRRNRKRADLVLPNDQFQIVAHGPDLGQPWPTRFQVLCALGQPARFLASLPHPPSFTRLLPDHDPLTAGNLFDAMDPSLPIVVTAKDWVKLRNRTDLDAVRILVAQHTVSIEPEPAFRAWLAEVLNAS